MIALKITAERIALLRRRQMHDVERRNFRVDAHEHGWNNREILGHVVGDGKW